MEDHAWQPPLTFVETGSASGVALRLVPAPWSTISAASVWSEICAGSLKVAGLRLETRRIEVVLERRCSTAAPAVLQRRRRILELVLGGTSECAIAIDLCLAPSTISQELKQALSSLGLPPRLSALPLPIAQIYHAAVANRPLGVAATVAGARTIVLLPRPERALRCLSPTELLVCQLMLAGNTHAQIATTREKSCRTIANQLASIFGKLRVSGRLELISLLALQSLEQEMLR